MTMAKNKHEIIEFDLMLKGGPEHADPADVAAANRDAMAALGTVGAIPPRKKQRS
jgi:hypothetical protein